MNVGFIFLIYTIEASKEVYLSIEGWTLQWYRRRENVNLFLFELELGIWTFSDSR